MQLGVILDVFSAVSDVIFFHCSKEIVSLFLFRGLPHVWDLIMTGEYCLKMNGVIIIKTQPNILSSSLQFSQPDIIYYT